MTDLEHGVVFQFFPAPAPKHRIAWISPTSNAGWLAYDRNGNGAIEDASELFSNLARINPRPTGNAETDRPNGFRALSLFDDNHDGKIDASDSVWPKLLIWRDRNMDGVGDGTELSTLASHGVTAISLEYSESRREDQFGNKFMFRAKTEKRPGSRAGEWIWDVSPAIKAVE